MDRPAAPRWRACGASLHGESGNPELANPVEALRHPLRVQVGSSYLSVVIDGGTKRRRMLMTVSSSRSFRTDRYLVTPSETPARPVDHSQILSGLP
jgi:hypothetical protein